MSKFQEPFHSTILKRIHTIFKFHVSNFSKGMYLYFHFSTPFIKYIHTKAMAGQEQGMDLNSRERRLYNRRMQQQQLLSTLAETMMQGQSSSSSTGASAGGLQAVGQLLVDWSKGRQQGGPQPKKTPVVVPPPKKATAAAPPLVATAELPTEIPCNADALMQLGQQLAERVEEQKEQEWYKVAAKEEEETEPPSSNEAKAPSTPPWRKKKAGTEAPPKAENEDNKGKDEKKVEETESAAADKQPQGGEKKEVEVQPVVEHLQGEPADDQKSAKEVEKTGYIDIDYGSSPTSPGGPLEVKQEDGEIRSSLVENYKTAINALEEAMVLEETLGLTRNNQITEVLVKELTEMMQGQRPEIKRRYKQETAGSEEDDKRKEEKGDKSGKDDKSGSPEKRRKKRRKKHRTSNRTRRNHEDDQLTS